MSRSPTAYTSGTPPSPQEARQGLPGFRSSAPSPCADKRRSQRRLRTPDVSGKLHQGELDVPSSRTDVRGVGIINTMSLTCRPQQVATCNSWTATHLVVGVCRYSHGGRVADYKTSAVAAIVETVSRLGTTTHCDNSGGQIHGGHSLRTGDAQYLAGLGVDPTRIHAMGQLHSSPVIRYSCNKGSPASPLTECAVSLPECS